MADIDRDPSRALPEGRQARRLAGEAGSAWEGPEALSVRGGPSLC